MGASQRLPEGCSEHQVADVACSACLAIVWGKVGEVLARKFGQNAVDDALQSGWFSLQKAIPKYDPAQSLFTWAYAIAYHKVMDSLRKHYRRKEISSPNELMTLKSREGDPADNAANNETDTAIKDNEIEEKIWKRIRCLEPEKQWIFFLYRPRDCEEMANEISDATLADAASARGDKGMTYEEISQLLGKSPDYVRRTYNAIKRDVSKEFNSLLKSQRQRFLNNNS